MKKVLATILAGSMMFGITACSSTTTNPGNETSQASDDTSCAVSVILKTTASEYWQYVVAGAEAYGKEHPDVRVDVKGASSETAYDEQQNMIETDLNSGAYDAFVIAPLQADLVKTLIAGQTVPIVNLDTRINAPEVISFVGIDQEAAAVMGAEAAVEAAKAAGWTELKAIAISGVQGDNTATARLNGYRTGIEEAGGIFLENEIQYADAVADKAANSMEAIIQNHPEGIAMIVCNNDDMAMAAARIARNHSAYEKTIFVGFDGISSACKSLLAGEETLSVAYDCYDLGYKAVEAAVMAINGEPVEENISVEASVISKDDAQERLDYLNELLG